MTGQTTPPSPGPMNLTLRDGEPVNPALAYEQSVSQGSRPAVRSVLCVLSGMVLGRSATWVDAASFPWWQVTRPYADRIRALLIEKNYAPRSVNRALSILRGVLTSAWNAQQMANEDYQRAVAVRGVGRVLTKTGRALEPGEVAALLSTCATSYELRQGTMYAAIVSVMYAGGLRRAEVPLLDRSDVLADGDDIALAIVGKRRKRRTVFLGPGVAGRLRAWLDLRGDTPGPLFLRKHGTRLTPGAVHALIADLREKAQVAKFTPHDLRRSFATYQIAAGTDLSLVRDMMGHADIGTTLLYDRRGEKEQKKAARRVDVDHDHPPAGARE